ncbi:hypothetical protein LTR94_038724, partial [Friedmanniomyces endolithicus]
HLFRARRSDRAGVRRRDEGMGPWAGRAADGRGCCRPYRQDPRRWRWLCHPERYFRRVPHRGRGAGL